MVDIAQADRMATAPGFIAALDQSGGSTPRALSRYGIGPDAYGSDAEMFDLVHAMRARIISSPAFSGEKIIGAILFEQTMDRDVDGRPTGEYLWQVKNIVPFVKVDEGLAERDHGVQLMKEMVKLDGLLDRAVKRQIFGTKMRSVVWEPDERGVQSIVDQQFRYAASILDRGLVPILEPEVNIEIPRKAEVEQLLKAYLAERLDALPSGTQVMLKLTIPDVDGFYSDLIAHPAVLRAVALSGGYSRAEADERLARNPGLSASFSRALLEGLDVNQTAAEFDAQLRESIDAIYVAATT
jgi:fructose-bisphosphate aldolase class I